MRGVAGPPCPYAARVQSPRRRSRKDLTELRVEASGTHLVGVRRCRRSEPERSAWQKAGTGVALAEVEAGGPLALPGTKKDCVGSMAARGIPRGPCACGSQRQVASSDHYPCI